MKKITKIIMIATLLLISFGLYAAPSFDPNAEMVQQTIAEYMKKNNIPGVAVELYVDGKPYSYYFGYANQEKKVPVTKNTIFEVGSVSKVMTSILLAEQIDVAKMHLEDPVKKYLRLSDAFEEITLEDLATHLSGLPFSVPNTIKTRAQLDKYLTSWSSELEPGDQWIYSNFGMGMLGYALEAATHKNFNALYTKQISSPLGMQPIGLTVPVSLKRYYAQGYDKNGKAVNPSSAELLASSWGVKASANDMQRFLSAAIGLPGTPTRIFYPMRLTQTAYVELADRKQGLGWQIHSITPENVSALLNELDAKFVPTPVAEIYEKPVYDGNALIDKTGATDGFRAYVAVIPNKKSGIVILTNKSSIDSGIVNAGREILFKLNKISMAGSSTATLKRS